MGFPVMTMMEEVLLGGEIIDMESTVSNHCCAYSIWQFNCILTEQDLRAR